jgi:Fe-S cluster biogenesis protein NfuA
MSAIPENEVLRRLERLESLIEESGRLADPAARALAREMVQTILDFHGAAVAELLEGIAARGEEGVALIHNLATNKLVSSLLLLYGLHPLCLETRVQQALESVRPFLKSHGGGVELLGVADGVIRLRLQGSCHGCPSSSTTFKLAIEEAIVAAAPDAAAIEIEGVVTPEVPQVPHLVTLEPQLISRSPAIPEGRP